MNREIKDLGSGDFEVEEEVTIESLLKRIEKLEAMVKQLPYAFLNEAYKLGDEDASKE